MALSEGLVERLKAEPDGTGEELLSLASDPGQRRDVIGFLSKTGTTDAARLKVLEILDQTAEPEDAVEIARVSVRQRGGVLGPTLGLLGSLPTPGSLFALAKVFAVRDDEHGARARELAAAMRASVPAALALEGRAVEDDPTGGLALAAAALPPEALVHLREGETNALKLQLEEEIAELDAELRERSKEGGSLAEFDARLRDELYEVVALTGLPADDDLQKRAVENLFRRPDLGDVGELVPHLPPEITQEYVSRALTKANRRGPRKDRSLFALELLRSGPDELWHAAEAQLRECLDDDDPVSLLGAARALAVRADSLDPATHRRLADVFASLDRATQQQVVGDFESVLSSAAHDVDLQSFIRWVEAAEPEELPTRLEDLLSRLVRGSSFEDVEGVLRAYLARREALASREELDRQAASAVGRWVHGQERRTVEAAKVIEAADAQELVVGRLADLLEPMRADQARTYLGHLLAGATPEAEEAVLGADLPEGEFERLLLPVLAEHVRQDPRRADALAARSAGGDLRRLLAAGLLALQSTRAAIADLAEGSDEADMEAISAKLNEVIDSIDVAERAAAGNDDLLRHFAVIRQTMRGMREGGAQQDIPEAVRQWRVEAAVRYPRVVEAPGNGLEPLRFADDFRGEAEDVRPLLDELDQRAHSARVTAAEDRAHHVLDVAACARGIAAAGLLDGPGALDVPSSRAALSQTLWGAWAETHRSEAGARLAESLTKEVERGQEASLVLRVDALATMASTEELIAAATDLDGGALLLAWKRLRPALVSRARELAALEGQARARSVSVMERIGDSLSPSLRALESVMASYFRMRRLLSDAGWKPVEQTLGRAKSPDELVPTEHQVLGPLEAPEYFVRTHGIKVRGHVIDKAIVEAVEGEDPEQ